MSEARLDPNGKTLDVRVPLALRRRGGRKLVVAPEGANAAPQRAAANTTLIRNLARAFRWRKLLESGEYGTIAELAQAEGVNDSYLSRALRLTLLAPAEVERALAAGDHQASCAAGGRQPHMFATIAGPCCEYQAFVVVHSSADLLGGDHKQVLDQRYAGAGE